MQHYKPNFDFQEFKEGMNHFINRLENNRHDWVIRDWTRKAVFHYLLDYYEDRNIEKDQLVRVYKEGCRLFNNVNFKFIVGLSIRLYEHAQILGLESEYLKVYEKALTSFLVNEISYTELQNISLSNS